MVLEGRPDQGQASLDVAHRQARPPGEVLDLRRAMAAEIAAGQLGESLFALQPANSGRPLLEQRVGELLAPPRPADDNSLRFGRSNEVGEALALRRDVRRDQHLAQLGSRQEAAAE